MKTARIVTSLMCDALLGIADQNAPKPQIKAEDNLPGPIRVGNCTESRAGYVPTEAGQQANLSTASEQEIGAYVLWRLRNGYSLALFPMQSGRIHAEATCYPAKGAKEAPAP